MRSSWSLTITKHLSYFFSLCFLGHGIYWIFCRWCYLYGLLIHKKYVSTFPDFLWLSLRCFYLVLQPEVLSHATGQPVKILGVPSLLPKLQQTHTEMPYAASFSQQPKNWSKGKHSTVTAGRHGTRELQMQKAVERHTQIHIGVLFGNVTTSQDCTGKKKSWRKIKKKRSRQWEDCKKLHMPLHLPFVVQFVWNGSTLAFKTHWL